MCDFSDDDFPCIRAILCNIEEVLSEKEQILNLYKTMITMAKNGKSSLKDSKKYIGKYLEV